VTSAQRYFLSFVTAAIVAALLFLPGLSGSFIFDDYPNLALLEMLPANPAWEQILALSENGIAGILGRPLALITFLLQAESFPGDAGPFKLVNLLIHLVNGALVMGLLALLGANDARFRLGPVGAGLVVLLWLIHPIQVSGVLYVVQRMNLLATFFVLLGLNGYLWWRLQYLRQPRWVYLFAMALIPAIAVLPGMFSKENAVLIYAYLAVIELLLGGTNKPDWRFFRARLLAVGLPLLLIVLGALVALPSLLAGYEQRPFGPGARLLTQSVALLSYLLVIFLPRQSALGLFHDDFTVFASPASLPVLVSVALLLAAVVLTLRYRRSWPVPAFMLLWFLAGHAMESSILPLQMYFEHRNYLPLFGILLGIGLLGQSLWQQAVGGRRATVIGATLLVIIWPALLTFQQAALWADPLEHAYAEKYFRPDSRAAHANLVQMLANSGQVETALDIHLQVINAGSESVADYVRWLEFGCLLPGISLPADSRLQQIAAQADQDYAVVGAMNRLIPAVSQGRCAGVSLATINVLLEALLGNAAFTVSRPDLLQLRATTAASAGNYRQAASLADQSYGLRKDVSVGLLQLHWLIAAQQWQEAANELASYRSDFAAEIAARAGLRAQLEQIRAALAAAE
jgi:hypothetical protein